MILKPEELTKVSLIKSMKDKLVFKIIDKEERDQFLADRLGSDTIVSHFKELLRSSESDIERWHSDDWSEWDIIQCNDEQAFFLLPSGENISHAISSTTEDSDEDRYILRTDDSNLACVDSLLFGFILTLRALNEACEYRGYDYDVINNLDYSASALMNVFDDALYHVQDTPNHPDFTEEVKLLIDKIRETVANQLN